MLRMKLSERRMKRFMNVLRVDMWMVAIMEEGAEDRRRRKQVNSQRRRYNIVAM